MDDSKKSSESPEDEPQPVAMEVESARLLGNEWVDELTEAGLDEQLVRQLADEFIAEHPKRDPSDFPDWARNHESTRTAQPQ